MANTMLKEERHQLILSKVNREGRATTNELTAEFGVSEDTIRKDFQELSREGKVQRIHGGVLRIESDLVDLNVRFRQQPSVKMLLAERAVDLVLNSRVLLLDSGSTNLYLAEAICSQYEGTAITNSPSIALQLCECPGADVILLGGGMHKTSKLVLGSIAVSQLELLNIECCVLGVTSLSPANGVTFPIYEEAVLKRAMLQKSKRVIAIATREKLNSVSAFYCSDLDKIDTLVTNETDPAVLAPYRQLGLEIISIEAEEP